MDNKEQLETHIEIFKAIENVAKMNYDSIVNMTNLIQSNRYSIELLNKQNVLIVEQNKILAKEIEKLKKKA